MSYRDVIKIQELKDHLEDPNWVIIDCRYSIAEPDLGYQEYRQGHIPGALYVSLEEELTGEIIPGKTGRHPLPQLKDIVERLSSWGVNQDTQVVVYDHSTGAFAARLWWILNWLGHEKVAVVNGGWEAWVKDIGQIENMENSSKPSKFIPTVREDLAVDAQFVDSIRSDPGYLLLDSRSPERYHGIEEPIDPIAGHIPGAVSVPYHDNLTDEGLFKSEREIRDRFSGVLGDISPANTIFYCGSGVSAIHNLIAMRMAGFEMAKLYPGSWSEWITDPSRPIEAKS
jgi:thiosulfate/3-mercaptopyruvate sulfurtransferase